MSLVGRLLPWSCAALAGIFAFRRLDNTDTWWHLAAGRWIVEHAAVPTTDPFSFTVPDARWINTQWLFDVVLFALHRLGGVNALIVLSVLVHTAVVALAIGGVRRHLGPLGTTALGLWVVFVCQPRFAIRPEMFSFLLLQILVWLLIACRGANDRRLFLAVPLMVLWANMHALFAVGLVALACAVAATLLHAWRTSARWGTPARRRMYAVAGMAAAGTLVNPYLLDGALFPLVLLTRFDRGSVYRAIGEFRSPFEFWFASWSQGLFQVGFVLGVLVVASVVAARLRSGNRREFSDTDLFQLLLFVGLAAAAVLARRNISLFVLGTLPLVSASLADAGSRLTRVRGWPAMRAAPTAVLALAVGLGTWGALSNQYYRLDDKSHETGLGTLDYRFPARAAAFFERTQLPGPHYNDLSAGGYLAWSAPSAHGVFIDGRLEVYDAFFADYLEGLRDFEAWSDQAERFGVQSAILFHAYRNRHPLIRQLRVSDAWKLVYIDDVAVIFVRTRGNEATIARASASLGASLAETGKRLLAKPAGRGYPHAHVRSLAHFARALDVIGQRDQAVPFFVRSLEFDLDRRERYLHALWLGNYHFLKGNAEQARTFLLQAAEADPDGKQARALLEQLDQR